MPDKKKYLFGPVPSRRLGLSLGVDIVPFKTCSLDCVYCQLGATTNKTIERKQYVPIEPVLKELQQRLDEGLQADYITLSGSGEPTLNSRLGRIIDAIKKITNIPVAILTNGTLFYREDVRADCSKADLVVPSLDAADEHTFRKINRPHSELNIENIISGLCDFRNDFDGPIWLEVFLVDGFNTDDKQITELSKAIERINPDKVQLNTAVRPTTCPGINRLSVEKMQHIAKKLGKKCEIIVDFSLNHEAGEIQSDAKHLSQMHSAIEQKMESLLSVLKRRPCSLNDICSAMGIHKNEALKYIAHLQKQGVIDSEKRGQILFYKAK